MSLSPARLRSQSPPATPHWYVAYVTARHEKRVADHLRRRGIEHYVPLYTAVRQWNRRRAQVELPLFPGYGFVRIPLAERLQVLTIPSVVCLVGTRGAPEPLDDNEVEAIRDCLARQNRAEPTEYPSAGRRVRVVDGPLKGLQGVIERQNGHARFIVSVDMIQRSIAVNVALSDLESVEPVLSGRLKESQRCPIPRRVSWEEPGSRRTE